MTTESAPTYYFEDLTPGRRLRHPRGATIGDVEGSFISKQVMNTAQAHWNDHFLDRDFGMGEGKVVFGLVTASMVFGLASQDITENAVADLSCSGLRFKAVVRQGDTLYALSEVRSAEPSTRADCGFVGLHHWGIDQTQRVVFEADRTILVKRRRPLEPRSTR